MVGGAHGSRGSSLEYGILTQPIAKDSESVKEQDILHENGKGVELVGKQEGKLTKVEILASISPISQIKVAESMQWEKRVGFPKKDEKAGVLETYSNRIEHIEPSCVDVKIPGLHYSGPNLVVASQAQLGVDKDSTEFSHQAPSARPDPLILISDMQVRKWTRIHRPAQDSFTKLPSAEVSRARPKFEASETQPAKKRRVCCDEASSLSVSSVVAVSQPRRSP